MATKPPASKICGDVTGDGLVTMGDVALLSNHVADPVAYPINSDWNGDVNGDGIVDMNDVTLLLNHVTHPAAYPLNCSPRRTVTFESIPTGATIEVTPL